MSYRVVCISRDVGAGGEDIGRAVASQLGFRYVDEQIVQRVAEQSGLDHARVAGVEERRGLIARLLDAVEQSAAGLPEPYMYAADVQLPGPPGDDVRELIRDAVRQTADEGDVVIVAHAASHVLAGRTEALRVWVTGSPDACAQRLVAHSGVDAKRAGELVEGGRKARADYLRRFHDVKQELPSQYDVVLSTDALSVDDAAAAVVMLAGRG
jgi:cytidylate kinase